MARGRPRLYTDEERRIRATAAVARWQRDNKRVHLINVSRARAKKAGMEHTIAEADLDWPIHCPVLGIELVYRGNNMGNRDNSPSIDRIDNAKGYVPGNVRVISFRANRIKNDASWHEIYAVSQYVKQYTPPPAGLEEIW